MIYTYMNECSCDNNSRPEILEYEEDPLGNRDTSMSTSIYWESSA